MAEEKRRVPGAPRSSRESSLASGWTIEGQEAPPSVPPESAGADPRPEEGFAAQSDAASEAQQLSNGALVLLGLIGGVYLLYTIVWFSWANWYSSVNSAVAEGSGSIGGVLQQIVFWFAPFAPALWFLSVLALCRGAALWKKALWLVVGAVVLVPLPMFGGVL